jgi:hypothetical protein
MSKLHIFRHTQQALGTGDGEKGPPQPKRPKMEAKRPDHPLVFNAGILYSFDAARL